MLLAEASLTSITLVISRFLLARTNFISISVVISRLYLLKIALIALGQIQLIFYNILKEAFGQKMLQKKANDMLLILKFFFIFKPTLKSGSVK